MTNTIFFAMVGMGQKAGGSALVAKDGFSARYDLDRVRGLFSRPEHKLAGESYIGRVLVLDAAKGGVATAWMLYEMKARGVMPAALVLNTVNPIMVQGAVLADFTMISGFDVDITQAIPNGALVEVNPVGERPFIRIRSLIFARSTTQEWAPSGECPRWVCAVARRRFPVGASPTRQPLQPEATGAVMEVTKWLKPSD